MTAYIVRRLLYAVFVVFGVVTLVFFSLQLAPGDPISLLLPAEGGGAASQELAARLRTRYGLDLPLHQQYLRYLTRVLQGDLGTSIRTGRPVTAELQRLYPATLELTLAALVVAIVVGTASGVLASLASSDLRRALIRLPADICALRPGMSLQAASAWVQGSFDLLVEVARLRDGRVRTLRVAEIGYSDQSAPVLHDIFRFNVQRVAVGGSVEGSFGPTGYVPRIAAQLQALGANIESSMFSRPPSR